MYVSIYIEKDETKITLSDEITILSISLSQIFFSYNFCFLFNKFSLLIKSIVHNFSDNHN